MSININRNNSCSLFKTPGLKPCEEANSSISTFSQAAMFGKGFVNTLSPDTFYNMCQMLRVLNAIRDYTIGIPLTYKQ